MNFNLAPASQKSWALRRRRWRRRWRSPFPPPGTSSPFLSRTGSQWSAAPSSSSSSSSSPASSWSSPASPLALSPQGFRWAILKHSQYEILEYCASLNVSLFTTLKSGYSSFCNQVGVLNLESNCTTTYNSSCDPTSLSCYFISSLSKSKAVKLNHFTSEEGMMGAFSRANLRASIKVTHIFI